MRITQLRSKQTPDIARATRAFEQDWDAKNAELEANPILLFLERHELAGSPNELTITGLGDVRISLGDLRSLVRLLK